MKKYFIFTAIIAALVLGLAACSGEKLVSLEDADAAGSASGDDVPIGGPFVVPDGGIPVEDESAAADDDGSDSGKAGGGKAKNKGSPGSSDVTVKILKSSKTFGKVLLGKHYAVTVKAKGKDVAMSATGLPPGLTASSPKTSSKTLNIEGIPTELGEYTITIEAHSTSDETNKAEKQFTMKVVEDLALNAYKIELDSDAKWIWTKIESFKDDAITIPFGQAIRLEVRDLGMKDEEATSDKATDVDVDSATTEPEPKITGDEGVQDDGSAAGKADKYNWSVNDAACTSDTCETGNFVLTSVNPFNNDKTSNDSIRFLMLKPGDTGESTGNLNITVSNVNGDTDFINIASGIFANDPCSTPLGFASDKIEKTIKIGTYNADLKDSFAFKTIGGSDDIDLTIADNAKDSDIAEFIDIKYTEGAKTADLINASITASLLPGNKMEDLEAKKFSIEYTITAKDNHCNNSTASASAKFNFAISDDNLNFKKDDYKEYVRGSANDTDNDGVPMVVFIRNEAEEEIAEWDGSIDMDQYGDNGPGCDGDGYDDSCDLELPAPDMKFKNKDNSIKDIKSLHIQLKSDNDWMENLDLSIWTYNICIGDWVSKLAENIDRNECDDDDAADVDTCDWYRDVVWYVKDKDYNCDEPLDDYDIPAVPDDDITLGDIANAASGPEATSVAITSEGAKAVGVPDSVADAGAAIADPVGTGVTAAVDWVEGLF